MVASTRCEPKKHETILPFRSQSRLTAANLRGTSRNRRLAATIVLTVFSGPPLKAIQCSSRKMTSDDDFTAITVYLKRLSGGDADAEGPLAEAVYSQLQRIARGVIRNKPE